MIEKGLYIFPSELGFVLVQGERGQTNYYKVPQAQSEVSLEMPDRDGGIQRLAAGCLLPDWPGKYRRVGMVRVT